jgi:hypothetical protein
MSAAAIISVVLWAVAGFGFGLFYLATLRRTVQLFGSGGGWRGPVLLTLGRLAGAGVFLGLAATFGAPSLLAAFAGFLVARAVAMRRARRAV